MGGDEDIDNCLSQDEIYLQVSLLSLVDTSIKKLQGSTLARDRSRILDQVKSTIKEQSKVCQDLIMFCLDQLNGYARENSIVLSKDTSINRGADVNVLKKQKTIFTALYTITQN